MSLGIRFALAVQNFCHTLCNAHLPLGQQSVLVGAVRFYREWLASCAPGAPSSVATLVSWMT